MNTPTQGSPSAEEIDFYAASKEQIAATGSPFVFETLPWDIGAAQPHVIALEEAGAFHGRVLDTGCGLGDNAIYLALRGHHVMGVDCSPAAISQAGDRASARGANLVEFRVADATRLDDVGTGYDSILSSALYHSLPDHGRLPYAAAIHRVSAPGAHLHLLTFADDLPESYPLNSGITQDKLRTTFDAHWNIDHITQIQFSTTFTPDSLDAVSGKLLSQRGSDHNPAGNVRWQRDSQGHLQLEMWYLHAIRI
ncbi:class I SAM-dependent methyltransferase [Streptomyces sp. 8N114]|uniref:class I SAM-dependent methyltransferase n=1 Tax=Streptomyces sp. 8N114 TaxID=3457419 RepID=UPI003FD27AEB